MWDAKKSEVTHLRLTPGLMRAARESATIDHRRLQDQLAVLIEESLKKRGHFINEHVAEFEQMELQDVAERSGPAPHVAKHSQRERKRA